jgi:hypothetical protein
MNNKNYN